MGARLRHRMAGVGCATLVALAASVVVEPASWAAAETVRISVSDAGVQANGVSTAPKISADGQHVAFVSAASNLVPGDTNGATDVFVKDLATGAIERVNVTTSGAQSTGTFSLGNANEIVALNADGTVVAFLTNAALVPSDTNGTFDAYVRDRAAGVTERVSVTAGGEQANSSAQGVSISADGSRVAFVSSQLASSSVRVEVFVRDRAAATTINVSPPVGQVTRSASSGQPSISANGRYVAFGSTAWDLGPEDTNEGGSDIYVRDLAAGTTSLVSLSTEGLQTDVGTHVLPAISADGRYVTFRSNAAGLVPGDGTGTDYFLRDTSTATTTKVTVGNGTSGTGGVGGEPPAPVSADGRYVAFTSAAMLAPGGSTGRIDVYLRDTVAGSTSRISQPIGSSLQSSFQPTLSADGRFVAFASNVTNLVPDDTNSVADVFRHDRAGDGTPPVVNAQLTPATPDGDNGWYRSDVKLTWTVADPESPVTTTGCVNQDITTDQPTTTYICAASSAGGASDTVTVQIGRDETAPTITGAVSPTSADGAAGWYVTAPTISYQCTDATSGIAHCPASLILGEGTDRLGNGTGRDQAGNQASTTVGPFAVDLTDPTLSCAEPDPFLLNGPGQVHATVRDDTSGPVASQVVADADTTVVGTRNVQLVGADNAGRTAQILCGYQVGYAFGGFDAPVSATEVNVVKAGATVPLRWGLADSHGDPVTGLAAATVRTVGVSCDPGAAEEPVVEEPTTGTGLLNLGDGRYQFNWKIPKSYAGTCKVMHLDLGEGTTRTASFRFLR